MVDGEAKPLLEDDRGTKYTDETPWDASTSTTAPIAEGADELPPSYQSTLEAPSSSVTCRVCQALIDVTGRLEQHVVKCNRCSEATPIRKPPAGKKYVRCPCHCLLICKISAQRIACPRVNCKRIIHLSQSPLTPPIPSVPGMCKVTCVQCRDTFLFNTLKNALARCPHCRVVSSVGPEFARRRSQVFFVLSILFFIIGTGVTVGTYERAAAHGGYVVAYVGAFLLGLIFLIRSLYYYFIKVSIVVGPI